MPQSKTKVIRSVGETNKSVSERRFAVVSALKRLQATSGSTGRTCEEIAKTAKLTRFDAYGQLYHTHLLQTGGFVKQTKADGERQLRFYLTAKGAKASAADVNGD